MDYVLLQSSDDFIFKVDVEQVRQSTAIKNTLKIMERDDDKEVTIPLAHVSSIILQKIIDWFGYHVDKPAQELQEDEFPVKCTDDILEWDADFIDVEDSVVYEILVAANRLDIKELQVLCCKKVANNIKECGELEKIRRRFNIENDFTVEEVEDILSNDEWFNLKFKK